MEMLSSQQEVNMFLKRRENRKAVEKMTTTQEGRASQVALVLNNQPASAGGTIRHSLIPGWEILQEAWQPASFLPGEAMDREEPGRLQLQVSKLDTTYHM